MADYISQFTGGEIDRRLAKVSELEAGKQDKLVSGETIKTIGGQSVLGEGNIPLTDQEAVKFTPQTLTGAQKAQALTNIGAASEDEVAALADQKYEGPYESAAALPTASASTMGAIYLVGPDSNGEYDRYVTKVDGSTYTWGSLGKTSIDLSNYATKAEVGELEAEVDELINGERVPEYVSLEDIGVAIPNAYMNSSNGKPQGTTNCIITKPIYLNVGDEVSCETGGTGIVLFFSLNNGDAITYDTVIKSAIQLANDAQHNTTYNATIEEAGWYGFSGRNNRNDGTNLSVSVTKYSRENSLDERFAEKADNSDLLNYATKTELGEVEEKTDNLIDGELVQIPISLEDIGVAIPNEFMSSSNGKPNGAANCIITNPIYLEVGDVVSCETGGTSIVLFFSLNDGSPITTSTSVKQSIKVANDAQHNTTYEATIEEAGWYGFSGRNNRNDGTNLVVSITKHQRKNSLDERFAQKADKGEMIGDFGLIALSVGADSVKDEIPETPWFDAVPTDGTTYGNYLDDKLDSVPFGKSFIFITDVHYPGNRGKSAELIDYARRRLGIKTIFHGGDVLNEAATIAGAAEQWLNFERDYVFRMGGDFKQVVGDHDHNGGQGHENLPYEFIQKMLTGYNAKELVFDNLYDEDVAELGWSSSDMSQYNAWKRMHYYFDDLTIKTRFVVLHTGWTGEGGLAVEKLGANALNETNALYLQMDFLYRALMTTPEGYNVVIVGHNVIGNPAVSGQTGWYDTTEAIYKGSWQQVVKQISAFKSKDRTPQITIRMWGTGSTSTKTYDYANAPTVGKVLCLGGDVHWDILAKASTSNYNLSAISSGDTIDPDDFVLQVVTMTDGSDRGYRDENGDLISQPATPGTLDSQAFDIVTIAENGIYFTRIGSGNDRVIYFN